jgi:hypothetical protein
VVAVSDDGGVLGGSCMDHKRTNGSHRTPYLGALNIMLQNGFNVWRMNHLESPFFDQFWVYGSPIGDSLIFDESNTLACTSLYIIEFFKL